MKKVYELLKKADKPLIEFDKENEKEIKGVTMTNKERQESLDKRKWLESEKTKVDCSGTMIYCAFCEYKSGFKCKAAQQEREVKCLCAKAFNRMSRAIK